MAINFLFGWASGNNIDIPKKSNGETDIGKLFEMYNNEMNNLAKKTSPEKVEQDLFLKIMDKDYLQQMNADEIKKAVSVDLGKEKVMTAEEKIKSVHIKDGIDNVLPELNIGTLKEIGVSQNKKVLVKNSLIERNKLRHPEVKREDYDLLIGECLYNNPTVSKGKNPNGTYFSLYKFVKISDKDGGNVYGAVLLDVNETLENFEVVHWHWVDEKKLKSLK